MQGGTPLFSWDNCPTARSAYYNGIQTYINSPLKGLNNFSFHFWFKKDSAGVWTDVFTTTDGLQRLELGENGNYYWFSENTDSSYNLIPSGVFLFTANDNNWHHFCLTYDRNVSTVRVYLDGNQTYSYTGSVRGFLVNYDSRIYFMSRAGIQYYKGYLADICFEPNTLDPAAVKYLYKYPKKFAFSADNIIGTGNSYSSANIFKGRMTSIGQGLTVSYEDKYGRVVISSTGSQENLYGYAYLTDSSYYTSGTTYLLSFESYNASDNADIRVHLEGGSSFTQTSCSGTNTTVIKNVIKRQWIKVWGIFSANDTTKLMFYPKPYTAEFSSGYQMFRNIQIISVSQYRGFVGSRGTNYIIEYNGSLGASASINPLVIYNSTETGRAAFNFNIDIDLTIPIKDNFLTSGNFTLITRLNPLAADLENYRGVGGWHIGSYKGLVFMQYENGVFAIGGGNGSSWLSGFQIPAWSGTYKTIAIVMDSAKNMTVYVDGVSQGTKNLNIVPTRYFRCNTSQTQRLSGDDKTL
jgi:hypothetical protein